MLEIFYKTNFKKDYKLVKKRGYDIVKLQNIIKMLVSDEKLPEMYKDHQLTGNYSTYRECHIEPDWLLIYSIYIEENIITFIRTGTHSDLFKK
jgi:mRNA interferase YafQ